MIAIDPSTPADDDVQRSVRDDFGRAGLLAHLGAVLDHIGRGEVRIHLPQRAELTQQHGYFHAGATSTVADTAGGYAAVTLLPVGQTVVTVEYKLNFTAPALGDLLEATGTVLKAGRTITICRLEVHALTGGERTLVAVGQQTLLAVPQSV